MPALAHTRHEAFAVRRVRDLANGESQTASYLAVGYRARGDAAYVGASKLVRSPKVSARIAELQEIAARRALTTTERIAEQLDADRALAHQEGQAAAAVSASMAKAKLFGLIISRSERAQPAPALTTDEVVAGMIDELGEQGALDVVRAMEAMILKRIAQKPAW